MTGKLGSDLSERREKIALAEERARIDQETEERCGGSV
jgi:hypothetical protein